MHSFALFFLRSSLVAASWLTLGIAVATAPAAVASSVVNLGHSATWYEPERSGEGWILEVLDESRAAMSWYTYSESGEQRWLVAAGEIGSDETGDFIRFPAIYEVTGGRFGAAFDPAEIAQATVGEAILRFEDCAHGNFGFSAFGETGERHLQRLSRTMGTTACGPIHGVPGDLFEPHAGESGSWYHPDRSGEGLQLQWTSDGRALLAWYGFDADGNSLWLIGNGHREGERIVFPTMLRPQGGRFGTDFDPVEIDYQEWGRIEIELSCSAGIVHFLANDPNFGATSQDIVRLTSAASLTCPWNAPAFTSLYEIEVDVLPGTFPGYLFEHIKPNSIADDGTVVGSFGTGVLVSVMRFSAVSRQWAVISPPNFIDWPISVAADGSRVYATRAVSQGAGLPQLYRVEAHSEDSGWELLFDELFESSFLTGVSRDQSRVVGVGRNFGVDTRVFPWLWDAELGQRLLPLNDQVRGAEPFCVSNDGRVVAGEAPEIFRPGVMIFRGVRWLNEDQPELLKDSRERVLGRVTTCSAGGGVLFGLGQADLFASNFDAVRAWYWLGPGQMSYLKEPENEPPMLPKPLHASADGSILVGSTRDGNGFIWTPVTGLHSLRAMLLENENVRNWEVIRPIAVTQDGRKVLLFGVVRSDDPLSPWAFRAAVLKFNLVGAVARKWGERQ